MKRSYEDVLSEYGNIAYDESSTLINGSQQIIKTPVKFDSFDGICGIFDRTGEVVVFTGEYVTKNDAIEIVKRINLHDPLINAVKLLLPAYETFKLDHSGVDTVDSIKKLLEQCE